VPNDGFNSAPEMTSQGEAEDEEREPIARQDDERRATPADWPNKKDSVTDGVIRQLIDQIAQLQRVSDACSLRHVAVAAARN